MGLGLSRYGDFTTAGVASTLLMRCSHQVLQQYATSFAEGLNPALCALATAAVLSFSIRAGDRVYTSCVSSARGRWTQPIHNLLLRSALEDPACPVLGCRSFWSWLQDARRLILLQGVKFVTCGLPHSKSESIYTLRLVVVSLAACDLPGHLFRQTGS